MRDLIVDNRSWRACCDVCACVCACVRVLATLAFLLKRVVRESTANLSDWKPRSRFLFRHTTKFYDAYEAN